MLLCFYIDLSGNKSMLESRLKKLLELKDGLSDGEAQLRTLKDHVTKTAEKVPPRAKESMDRELNNLKLV